MDKNLYQGKKVLVIGMGISGFAVAKLLHSLGAAVCVNELNQSTNREQLTALEQLGIPYYGGGHDVSLLENIDMVVKNPGISYQAPFIAEIQQRGIPIITEPEVAMSVCKAKVIAITGTNGKTTTTQMIYDILAQTVDEVYVAGNIGIAFADVVRYASHNAYIILELSSFQLMGMPTFKPDIAVILNIGTAHLDYHTSLAEYRMAKYQIFANLGVADTLVVPASDEQLLADIKHLGVPCHIQQFSDEQTDVGVYVENDTMYFQGSAVGSLLELVAPGAHNRKNALAAIAVAKTIGIDNQSIMRALHQFTGVEHRLEFVQTLEGRHFYNDSKATNSTATKVALASFAQPVIWLAGGLERHDDIGELSNYCEHVKLLCCFGEAAPKFMAFAKAYGIKAVAVASVCEAVNEAYAQSVPHDVILLSPACASWDQFDNFEQRGQLFKVCCQKLMSTGGGI